MIMCSEFRRRGWILQWRSTDAARWPLRDDFEDLAPLRHIMEDLSSEKDILHLSQPMVVLYGCFHLSESMLARRL